ncbi:MAG TPA: hypothetical protein VFQ61_03230, partial [Polyangiaceae bacterium]|nr:hypothetical protein [Polyangiaceae bacterium]
MNEALLTLILTTGFASAGCLAYAVASAPTTQPDLLGIRGLKRIRAVSGNTTFARFEPLLRWLGTQLKRVLSDKTCAQLDRQLALAGDFLGLRAEEFVAMCGLFGLAGLLFGLGMAHAFAQPPEMVLGTAVIALFLPYTRLTSMQEERRRRATHGLPPVVDLLVLCLSAGLDFPGAVRHVVAKASNPSDAFIEELGFLLQELNVGKTRKLALTQLADRLPTDSMREF